MPNDTYALNLYEHIIRQEFPEDTEFGISFLADSEDYSDKIEPIEEGLGIVIPADFKDYSDKIERLETGVGIVLSSPSKKNITILSHFDYNEALLDNTIFSEVNRCFINGKKFLKIITPLFIGDSHDIILAPNRYLKDILYEVKRLKDYKINTSIHAPLIDLPLEELKRDILDFLDNPDFSEFCKQYSIKQKRGFIFSGPPGNGKTLSISWLKSQALQRKIDFTAFKSAKDYLENSEDIASGTKLTKKIIVFEEFDTYLQERDIGTVSNERIESNQVLGSLLQTLDGIEEISNVVFIFTTNYPQTLDSAIMRPGRIDKVINFGAPTRESQMKFLALYLSEYSLDHHSLIVDTLTTHNVHTSYAMLKSIVDNIRITEFWYKQEKAETQVTEAIILTIIDTIISSSNKGQASKDLMENVL